MTEPKYIIGIDLGTTHCVVAFTEADLPEDAEPNLRLFAIPQVVGPGEVQTQNLLPTFLLLPGAHDVPEGALSLPWDPQIDYAVGEYARDRGPELPNRMVSSAKSWLSYSGVDRTAPVLPWGAPEDARRVSPVETVVRYLGHVRSAWNHKMAQDDPGARFEEQAVYLTVPASFDAVARELTVQAAQQAGLHNLTLLEEPMAAFYSWLNAQGDNWRETIGVGDMILVCDVGGGTTDFSLIRVTEEEGNLDLHRMAVGDHILLGGDNMDLTLAYAIRGKLAQQGKNLDNWQFRGLVQSSRKAKERLLSNPDLDAEPVTILGRGSSLIGGTIRSELRRDEIEQILLQGFFPVGDAHEFPQQKTAVGMREMGLPYASDPAITRHLAQFLYRQSGESGTYPSAVLFNGGVMKAGPLRRQITQALSQWSNNPDLTVLESVDLDLSVALGAAYYGLVRKGRGIRIRAGTSRAYYIGIESAMPAVPGIPTPMKALCVVPFGMEEGSEAKIRQKEFGLVVGEPAVFHFLTSTTRKEDRPGQEVEDWSGEISEVATMETTLPASEEQESGSLVPIWLESRVTEVGTLELWCVDRHNPDNAWKLEFNIREQVDGAAVAEVEAETGEEDWTMGGG